MVLGNYKPSRTGFIYDLIRADDWILCTADSDCPGPPVRVSGLRFPELRVQVSVSRLGVWVKCGFCVVWSGLSIRFYGLRLVRMVTSPRTNPGRGSCGCIWGLERLQGMRTYNQAFRV